MRLSQCSTFTLTNNLIAGNHANTRGDGIAIRGTSSTATSAGLWHNTLADNAGSGIYVGDDSTVALTNTALVGNAQAGITVGVTRKPLGPPGSTRWVR